VGPVPASGVGKPGTAGDEIGGKVGSKLGGKVGGWRLGGIAGCAVGSTAAGTPDGDIEVGGTAVKASATTTRARPKLAMVSYDREHPSADPPTGRDAQLTHA
jgi:hypothetical protein